MNDTTTAHAFLAETGDIAGLIADLLDCGKGPGWHWPSFYLLYVELDRLSMLLMRMGHLLGASDGPGDGPHAMAEYAHNASDLLAMIERRQKTIVGSLWQLHRATRPAPEQQVRHDRVGAHVHPKSGWYQAYMRDQSSSAARADARALVRIVLPVDRAAGGERIDAVSAECMLARQSFDIGTAQARLALAQANDAAARRVGALLALMGAQLRMHCRIEDLLHPSSR